MTALFDCGVNSSSDFTSEELSSNEQAVDNTYHKGCSNISGSLFGACPMNKSLNSTKKTNNIHQSEKMECASLDVGAIIYQNFNKVGRPKTGINLTCATCGITFESRKQLYRSFLRKFRFFNFLCFLYNISESSFSFTVFPATQIQLDSSHI